MKDKRKFVLNDKELLAEHKVWSKASNEYWMDNLPALLHYTVACAFIYRNKLNVVDMVSDVGILHELIHLLHLKDEPLCNIENVRSLFNHTFNPIFGD